MRFIFILIILFISTVSNAQYSDWLRSDRPGQSMSPFTVGKKTAQLQMGYSYTDLDQQFRLDNNDEYLMEQLVNQVRARVRIGIFERFEGSAGVNYADESRKYTEGFDDISNSYVSQFDFNLRGNLYPGKGAVPAVGVELQFVWDDPLDQNRRRKLNTNGTLSLQSAITDKFSLTANVIVYEDLAFTINAGYLFTEKFGAFVEYYPIFTGFLDISREFNLNRGFINSGFIYNFGPNFQIDLASSFLVNQADFATAGNTIENYIGFQVGFTGRMDWRD